MHTWTEDDERIKDSVIAQWRVESGADIAQRGDDFTTIRIRKVVGSPPIPVKSVAARYRRTARLKRQQRRQGAPAGL